MSEKQATDILRKIQTYRLSDAANPPAKDFVLMGDPAKGGKEFRMNRPTGLEYWKMVHAIIDNETIEDRDRITLGTFAANLRSYCPKPALLNVEYKLPPLKLVE